MNEAAAAVNIQCGCGLRFNGTVDSPTIRANIDNTLVGALSAALDHSRRTGHTLELLGSIRPE